MFHSKLAATAVVLMSAAVGVVSASAADLPRAYTKAPVAAPIVTYNWTGCYIGGNVGGGWARTQQDQVGKVTGTPLSNDFGGSEGSNVIGGGQVGCDYQFGSLVVGIQGMFDFGTIKSTHTLPAFPAFYSDNRTKDIYTVTGRVGYLFAPQVLGYVKGGGAWARIDHAVYGFGPPSFLSETARNDRSGWTVGGGIEWMFAPGWSVFGEYNYADFGRRDVSFTQAPGTTGIADVVSTRFTTQQALFGVNYKFNWSSPIVAKY